MAFFISKKGGQLGFLWALLLGLLLCHLPFLWTDAPVQLSPSRGPFTDEGLYTVQLRNWLFHQRFSLVDCDGLVKTPGYSLWIALLFRLFGSALWIARLGLFLLSLSLLSIFFRQHKRGVLLLGLLLPIVWFKPAVFIFSHLALADHLASILVLLSCWLFNQYLGSDKQIQLYGAFGLTFMAFLFKIQFVYSLALIPLGFLVYRLIPFRTSRRMWRQALILGLLFLGGMALFLACWYWPMKAGFDLMFKEQSGGFSIKDDSWNTLEFIVNHRFLNEGNRIFTQFFLASCVIGGLIVYRVRKSFWSGLFIISLIWCLLESHKLLMGYFPTRYQISMFWAMGLLICATLGFFWDRPVFQKIIYGRFLVVAILVYWAVIHVFGVIQFWENRSYTLRETHQYLSQHLDEGQVVLGAWAPALTWSSDPIFIPVWQKNWAELAVAQKYQPTLIVAEPDQADSNQAYQIHGIDLHAISDSTKTVHVGRWTIHLHWVNGKALEQK